MPNQNRKTGWQRCVAVLPAIGAALLPRVACPCTLPAYAGLLSSMGLAFLLDTIYLLPLTALFLVLAVGALAFRAKRRRGYGPFVLGTAAAILLLMTKFVMNSTWGVYGGIALLIGASIWNAWPRRAKSNSAAPTEMLCQIGSNESEVQP
ncbi:MAG: MerC domain-containing protein [Planctomycetaceae bacterium]